MKFNFEQANGSSSLDDTNATLTTLNKLFTTSGCKDAMCEVLTEKVRPSCITCTPTGLVADEFSLDACCFIYLFQQVVRRVDVHPVERPFDPRYNPVGNHM